VDESVATKGTGDFDDPTNANGTKDGPTAEDDEKNVTLPPALTNPAFGDVIGAAQANGAGAFTISPGADGLGSAPVFALAIGNAATGLTDTQTGQPITLVDVGGGLIEGQIPGGTVV